MQKVIITAPSLDPTQNVSGVSSVVQFIIENNREVEYEHFILGKSDKETGAWNRVLRILRSCKRWKKTLSSSPIKGREIIIHYSFPLSAPSILRDPMFMLHALRKKYRMVVHVHGGLFLTSPKIPFVLNRILKWVFSLDIPFIVLSEGEKKTLQEKFGAKSVYVLPNCPDLSRSQGLTPSISLREREKELVLGYLGRIEPNKGMTELLKACQQLKQNGVNFKLRFAGKEQVEGEYLPLYRQWLGDNFEYVGLVSGVSKDAFLRSLDVFVMPTYFEGLPVSLLECMGYGVVPVVTPVGSIPDVVIDNDELQITNYKSSDTNDANGVFVKVKDVDSIVDAITMLYNDRETLAALGKNARKMIFENFSAERYVEQLNHIYNSL